MSVIQRKKVTTSSHNNYNFHMECFNSAQEVVKMCQERRVTDSSFYDMATHRIDEDWHKVKSYAEALDLMKTGYQPTVEKMRGVFKTKVSGEGKRFSFQNNIQGFAPVVPLALKGVPNCMMDMYMRPIKNKVVDVYYDMVASCSVGGEQIIKAGQMLLGSIIELERQGYRFNLYAVQSYSDNRDCDMMVVKLKDSAQPLDIKRISFPLTHTAFFRVIGFDWYSKVPEGKYRSRYGRALSYEFSDKELQDMAHQLWGKTTIYFSAAKIINVSEEHIKEVLSNGNSEN